MMNGYSNNNNSSSKASYSNNDTNDGSGRRGTTNDRITNNTTTNETSPLLGGVSPLSGGGNNNNNNRQNTTTNNHHHYDPLLRRRDDIYETKYHPPMDHITIQKYRTRKLILNISMISVILTIIGLISWRVYEEYVVPQQYEKYIDTNYDWNNVFHNKHSNKYYYYNSYDVHNELEEDIIRQEIAKRSIVRLNDKYRKLQYKVYDTSRLLLQNAKDKKKKTKKNHRSNLSIAQPGCVSTIMIVRHCEKDDTNNDIDSDYDDDYYTTTSKTKRETSSSSLSRHCSTIGYERAQYIATLFGSNSSTTGRGTTGNNNNSYNKARWPIPKSLYALTLHRTDHMNFREYETVVPLSTRYNISIEMTTRLLVIQELYDALNSGNLCNQLAVVCWKHSHIPELANNLGCSSKQGCPNHYNPYQYDAVYTLQFVLQQAAQQQPQKSEGPTITNLLDNVEEDISDYNPEKYLKEEVEIIYQEEKRKADKEAQKEKARLKKLQHQAAKNTNATSRMLKQQQTDTTTTTTTRGGDNNNNNNTNTNDVNDNTNNTSTAHPSNGISTSTIITTANDRTTNPTTDDVSNNNNDDDEMNTDDPTDNNKTNTTQSEDDEYNGQEAEEIELPVYVWTVYGSVQYENFVPKGGKK